MTHTQQIKMKEQAAKNENAQMNKEAGEDFKRILDLAQSNGRLRADLEATRDENAVLNRIVDAMADTVWWLRDGSKEEIIAKYRKRAEGNKGSSIDNIGVVVSGGVDFKSLDPCFGCDQEKPTCCAECDKASLIGATCGTTTRFETINCPHPKDYPCPLRAVPREKNCVECLKKYFREQAEGK